MLIILVVSDKLTVVGTGNKKMGYQLLAQNSTLKENACFSLQSHVRNLRLPLALSLSLSLSGSFSLSLTLSGSLWLSPTLSLALSGSLWLWLWLWYKI